MRTIPDAVARYRKISGSTCLAAARVAIALLPIAFSFVGCRAGDDCVVDERQHEPLVALIDSDFNESRIKESGFASFLWTNPNEDSSNLLDDDDNGYLNDMAGWDFVDNDNSVFDSADTDEVTHGDLMFNVLASTLEDNSTNGNTFSSHIMLLRALRTSDTASSVGPVISAIEYAERSGASICNLSMSSYRDVPELKRCIEESSMLFVVAAGNDGNDLDLGYPNYPASYKFSNVVSVAATDASGTLLDTSNYGTQTVDTAIDGTSNSEYGGKGTSIAAAKVSAIAALVQASLHKRQDGNSLKRILLENAGKTDSDKAKTISGYLNYP